METGEGVGTAGRQIPGFSEKGNMSRPLTDEEEDWEILMKEELGTVGTEESGRPGESRAGDILGLPVCNAGVVDGAYDDLKTTMCGLKSQPVHACAGNPIPLSKGIGPSSWGSD